MSRGVTSNPALEAWAARATQPVLLPSGTWAKVRPPDPEVLVRGNALPDDLAGIVTELVTKGIDTDELSPEQLLNWVAYTRFAAAISVVALGEDENGPWHEVSLTPEDLDDMPPTDTDTLRSLALRHTTARMVTAGTKAAMGSIDQLEAAAIRVREAGATVDGYRGFRGGQSGGEPREDRPDVRPEAERAAPRSRSRGRARG